MKAILYANQIKPSDDLHDELLAGVQQLALAVGSTLGPRGRNVIIDRPGETPMITKDGVTVAANIQLSNPVANAGAKLIQAVAKATADTAGDGTTTATVLAHAIFAGGRKLIASGASPLAVQRGIQAAAAAAVDLVTQAAMPVSDEQVRQVAQIAANGNEGIGGLISACIEKVGREGKITLDDSQTGTTWLDVRSGFSFDNGWMAPQYANTPEGDRCVFENPYILLSERVLTQGASNSPTPVLHDLGPILNAIANEQRPMLIVAEDVQGDAQASLLVNNQRGVIRVCAVKPPGFAESRRAALDDLALVTGATVLQADAGQALAKYTLAELGQAARIIVTNGQTVIEDGKGDLDTVQLRAQSLREQGDRENDPRLREQLYQRAARLTGSVAVIHVGANTEAEARELKDRVEDSVLAVRAALAEGIVPGGGLALFLASLYVLRFLNSHPAVASLSKDERLGAELLMEALEAPLRQIATNAGVSGDVVVNQILTGMKSQAEDGATFKDMVKGYNAATGEFIDLVDAGIVDPAKVVRVALEKASSIAGLMLTSSALVYYDPAKIPPAAQHPVPFLNQSQISR